MLEKHQTAGVVLSNVFFQAGTQMLLSDVILMNYNKGLLDISRPSLLLYIFLVNANSYYLKKNRVIKTCNFVLCDLQWNCCLQNKDDC